MLLHLVTGHGNDIGVRVDSLSTQNPGNTGFFNENK